MENLGIKSILQGKRVFVTGHTGFKGGWLLALLDELGAVTYGYALPPTGKSIFHNLRIKSLRSSTYADILDADELTKRILQAEPDIILHLAAQALVLKSYEHPVETFNVNTIGTGNLLKAIEKLPKPCVAIIVTTDKVYAHTGHRKPFVENDPLGGHDPYSASKAAAEIITQSFRESFFSPAQYKHHHKAVATARSGNVIGGGDWAENRIIPDIVRALAQKTDITLRKPRAVRPWQHVLEPLVGYLQLAGKLMQNPDSSLYSSAWNFGPAADQEQTVAELTRKAINYWPGSQVNYSTTGSRLPEADYLMLDSTKARKHLGWQPLLSFADTLTKTMAWYREFFNGTTDMTGFTKKQIRDYLHLLQ